MTLLPEWLRYDPSRYPLGYNPGLDGLRGTATLCVLAAHLNFGVWCPGAFLYMDMFFVMSAYLITSLLLKRWNNTGNIGFATFYLRRFLRLFPANYAMILTLVVVAYLTLHNFRGHLTQAAVAATYTTNWTRAFEVPMPEYLGHTWSLAVEEQFYLVWPVILALLLRAVGLRMRLVALIGLLALGFAGWRSWLTLHGASESRLFNGTDMRGDALLVGCALGVAMAMPRVRQSLTLQRAAELLALPSFVVLVVGGFTMDQHNRAMYGGISLIFTMASACLITALALPRQTIPHRIFRSPPLVFFGRICYGLYLWHYPIFNVIRFNYGVTEPVLLGVIGVPLTFVAALLSWRFIESPLLKAKDRLPIEGTKHVAPQR
jgi:peptidoglycan/LPS O-acetylase OafA/YrhL